MSARRGHRRTSRCGLAAIALAAVAAVLAAPRCDGSANGVEAAAVASADSMAADILAAARGAHPLLCDLVALVFDGRYGYGGEDLEPDVGRSQDPRIQAAFAWALEPEGAGDVSTLRAALADPDACVRRTAARLLGRSGDPAALDALRQSLRAADPETREIGALGLGVAQDETAIESLVSALRDDQASVRVAAAWALGRVENARAIEPLVGRLEADDDPRVRAAAAWALGEIE